MSITRHFPTSWMHLLCSTSFLLPLLLGGCTKDSDDSDEVSTDACGLIGLETQSSRFGRIINGTECEFGPSPVVFLKIGPAACTGTVISDTAILTAAHCFLDGADQSVTISSGSDSNVIDFSRRVVVHPEAQIDDQQQLFFNDVALVFASSNLNLPTLPLIVSRSPEKDDIISIYGYGQSVPGQAGTNIEGVGSLRSGQTRLSRVSPTHLFADFQGVGSNSCFGDSGGPALGSITKDGESILGIVGTVSGGTSESCDTGDLANYIRIESVSITEFIINQVPNVVLE